jgi:CheY-like chemotaxis protein
MESPYPTIAVIEDSEADFILFSNAISDGGKKVQLLWLRSGKEAMDYFSSTTSNGLPNQRPHLIFMDLNLPMYSGHEILSFIKKQPEYQDIPVIVLSYSDREVEKEKVIAAGAVEYIQKPMELTELIEDMQQALTRWI